MCELAVFVEALLYVILKAYEIFISVTVLLTTLAEAQAKNIKLNHVGSCVNFIDDQVGWIQLTFIVVVETLNSSLTIRRFAELKNTNDTVKKAI